MALLGEKKEAEMAFFADVNGERSQRSYAMRNLSFVSSIRKKYTTSPYHVKAVVILPALRFR